MPWSLAPSPAGAGSISGSTISARSSTSSPPRTRHWSTGWWHPAIPRPRATTIPPTPSRAASRAAADALDARHRNAGEVDGLSLCGRPTLPTSLRIRDKAIAIEAYARQAKNKSIEADAFEIRERAERKLCDNKMEDLPKSTGGDFAGRKPIGGLRKNQSRYRLTASTRTLPTVPARPAHCRGRPHACGVILLLSLASP